MIVVSSHPPHQPPLSGVVLVTLVQPGSAALTASRSVVAASFIVAILHNHESSERIQSEVSELQAHGGEGGRDEEEGGEAGQLESGEGVKEGCNQEVQEEIKRRYC